MYSSGPSITDLRKLRIEMFDKHSTQVLKCPSLKNTIPVFPGYERGPLVTKIGDEYIRATSQKQIISLCIENMRKTGPKYIDTIALQDLIDSLALDKNNYGIAVNLLHIYPFAFINHISTDSFKDKLIHPQDTSAMLKQVIETTCKSNTIWIGVPKLTEYESILMSLVSKNQCPPDPLQDRASTWGQFLHVPNLDRPYSEKALALYISNHAQYSMRLNLIKKRFEKFSPYTLPDTQAPLETNLLLRWKKACTLFNYSYKIEKLKRNHLNTHTFLRVPNDIVEVINDKLCQRNGRCSLLRLVQEMMAIYTTTAENIMTLLRHVAPNGKWIFAFNSLTGVQSTLPEGYLDYDSDNKGKYFWDTLSDLEKNFTIDLNQIKKDESVNEMAKKMLIGFRYECGLRKKENMQLLCPCRYSDRAQKIKHIKSFHYIDSSEMENIGQIFTTCLPLQSIESDQEFLKRKGVLEVFDVDQLSKIYDIGQIVEEFIQTRYRNKKLVTELTHMWEEYSVCHEKVLEKLEETKHMSNSHELNDIEHHIQEELAKKNFCHSLVKTYQKILLPNEILNKHLTCLFAAVQRQVSVMTRYNQLHETLEDAKMKACHISKAITSDWHSQLDKAGMNVATISSDTYLQHTKKEQTPSNYASLALGMISSLENHKRSSVEHVNNVYEKLLHGKEKEESSKRKRDEDEYQPRAHGNPEQLYKRVKKHHSEKGLIPSGDMLAKIKDLVPCNSLPVSKTSVLTSSVLSSFDLVLPSDIYADLRDHREFVLYLLNVIKNATLEQLNTMVRYAILNVLNMMFLFSDEGRYILDATLQKMIISVVSKNCSLTDKKRIIWKIFVSVVYFVNANPKDVLTRFFRVRLYNRNDIKKCERKVMPQYVFMYESTVNLDCDETKDFCFRHIHHFLEMLKQPTFLPERKHSVNMLKEISREQMPLKIKLKEIISKEIHQAPKTGFQNVHLIKSNKTSRLHTKIEALHSKDWMPIFMLPLEDAKKVADETKRIRSETCPICLETFSTRPLEVFNCIYKKLERQFKEEKSIDAKQNLEMNPILYEAYMKYASVHIDQTKIRNDNATGGHMFHRDCIRRAIQIAALDPRKETIDCPLCKEVIYTRNEKQLVLINLTELACELREGIENSSISEMDTDDLINLKHDRNGIFSKCNVIAFEDKGDRQDDSMKIDCDLHSVKKLKEEKGREECIKTISDYIRLLHPYQPAQIYDDIIKHSNVVEKEAEYALEMCQI